MQDTLLIKAENFFKRFGIRSVTMDDLAKELGISKKTLYQQVANKKELLVKVFYNHAETEQQMIADIRQQATSAIDELIRITRYCIENLRTISPSFIYDLEKYYPEEFAQFDEIQTTFFHQLIEANMVQGKKEGLYRADIDEIVIAKFFASMATNIGMNAYFPVKKFPLDKLVQQLMYYHINGIASAEGQTLVRRYLEQPIEPIS